MDPDLEVEGLAMSTDLPYMKRYMPRVVTPEPGTFKRQQFVSRSRTPNPIIKNRSLVTTIGGGNNLGGLKYIDQNVLDEYNGIGL